MKKSFLCSCKTHLIEIKYNRKQVNFWIGIYDICNPDTGRKYKKPKLVRDVWFFDSPNYTKEMSKIMKFLKNIATTYTIRKK